MHAGTFWFSPIQEALAGKHTKRFPLTIHLHTVQGGYMSVARITEISASSNKSFEDAVQQGVQRATATLRNVRSAWIKEQEVQIENNRISAYKVTMKITFVLEEGGGH